MKRRSMHAVLTMALAAAMTLGNVPITSFAASVESEAVDEEYQAEPAEDATEETAAEEEAAPEEPADTEETAPVAEEDEAEDADSVTVDKTALAEAIAAAQALTESDYTEDSWNSLQTALNNAQTVNDQSDVTQDVVDTATTALTDAQDALVSDLDAANVDEYADGDVVYVNMNIPFKAFYAAVYGNTANIDAVSTATTKGKAGAYIDAKTSYGTKSDSGSTIKGVTIPVQMDATTYSEVRGEVTEASADYYLGKQVTSPTVYLNASYANGTYTFSLPEGLSASNGGTIKAASNGIKYDTKRRDIEIELDGTNIPASTLYGGYVTTTDNTNYPLLPVLSMYKAKNLEEIGWSLGTKTVEEKDGAQVMNLQSSLFSGMKGKTLSSMTVITTSGITTYALTDSDGNPITVGQAAQDDAQYVLMNIPYDVFYNAESVSVDAVASATTKVRDSDRAGASYNGSGNATDTENVTVQSKGVQFPVKVSDQSLLTDSKYTEVTDSTSYTTVAVLHGTATDKTYTGKAALIQADDYAYYKLSDTPNYYVELKSDGTFSAVQGSKTSVTGSADNITFGGHHRKYEITLPDSVSGQIAGVTVTTDKLTFGLKTTDEIFNKDKEIGWDPTGDLADTNGAKLQSVTVYTDSGVYSVSYGDGVQLKTSSDASISATLLDSTGTVKGLPTDIQNPKVTVSSSTINDRGRKVLTPVSGLENVELTDGTFTIPEGVLTSDTEYTVTVSSDNYLDLSAQATYGYVYVLMNIPYADFEKLADSSVTVDAVSTATTKLRNAGTAGATYNGGGNQESTDDPQDQPKGVQFAVKVAGQLTDSKYTEVTNDTSYTIATKGRGGAVNTSTVSGKAALIQSGDYAYYILNETPANYLTLDENGTLGGLKEATDIDGTGTAVTNGGYHQSYEVAYPDGVSGTVAAVKVVTDKGTFWLRPTDQMWRSMEIGWTPTGNLADTNGATFESYTVYTDEGNYNVSVNQKLKTLSEAKISAALSGTTGTVTGLPEDIQNPKATVSITTGSGHNAQTTKYVEDADVKDGSFAISGLTDGTEYTVTVSSDNYLDLSATATYTMSGKQTPTPTDAYTIKLDANGGKVDPVSVSTKDGKADSLPTATRDGYDFAGWFTAADGGGQVKDGDAVTADITLYAHWTAKGTPEPATTEYTITFDPDGGTLDKTKATAVTTDGKLTSIPTPTRSGYTFDAWYTEKDGKGTKVTKDTSFTADTTVYANWKQDSGKGGNPGTGDNNGNGNGSSSSTGNVKTGDTAQPVLWATISAAAVAAIAIALVLRRRKRNRG